MRYFQRFLPVVFLLPSFLAACDNQTPVDDTSSVEASLSGNQLVHFIRGRNLFFNETFGGNGRTCVTCHLRNLGNGEPLDNNFDLTPADAQRLFAEDPTGPLFRAIDSDDGMGNSYTMLTGHALVRIPFTLPANITVDERDAWVRQAGNGQVTATVLRSSPTIENIAFENQLMWDGRFGGDLPRQAKEAVVTHDQPGRLPTQQEREDLAFYQQQFFTDQALRSFRNGGPAPVPPQVPSWLLGAQWDSARRGRAFFVDDGQAVVDATHRDLCATCHAGPLLNTTSNSNPVQPAGQRISNNFVAETNALFGLQLPEHTYHIRVDHDVVMPAGTVFPIPPGVPLFPAGTVFELRSSDPGHILTTGDPCESVLACLIQSNPAQGVFRTTSFFKIPTLWGVADSAPYFHDNSAQSLEDVMRVYSFLFSVTADGLNSLGVNGEPFRLSPQDVTDIINYVNFGFRRHPLQ